MSTVREQIIQAIIEQLNTGRPAGVPEITRLDMEPKQPNQLPAMTIFALREEVVGNTAGRWGHIVMRRMTVRVVMEAEGDLPDQALDPMLAWVSMLGGSRLGGLAVDVEEQQLEWAFEYADSPYASVALDLVVEYVTNKADSTSTT